MIELKDFVANIEREHDYAYITISRSDKIRVIYESPFAENALCATFIPNNNTAYLVEISESDMTVDEQVKYDMFGTNTITYHSNLIKELKGIN